MFKAFPWTAGAALIRLYALSSSTGWLVHAGLLPKASLSDHPPPRCDDDCYDSADKGQSKMSQAMGWTDGGYTGFGGMKEQGKMNWKLLPHAIFQGKTTWRLQKKPQGVIFLLMSLCLAPCQWSTVVDLFWAQWTPGVWTKDIGSEHTAWHTG